MSLHNEIHSAGYCFPSEVILLEKGLSILAVSANMHAFPLFCLSSSVKDVAFDQINVWLQTESRLHANTSIESTFEFGDMTCLFI
jgi:hypothetical protein